MPCTQIRYNYSFAISTPTLQDSSPSPLSLINSTGWWLRRYAAKTWRSRSIGLFRSLQFRLLQFYVVNLALSAAVRVAVRSIRFCLELFQKMPVLLLDSIGNHPAYVALNMQGINGILEQIDWAGAGLLPSWVVSRLSHKANTTNDV